MDVNDMWFQQDGVTCHTADAKMDILLERFERFANKPQSTGQSNHRYARHPAKPWRPFERCHTPHIMSLIDLSNQHIL